MNRFHQAAPPGRRGLPIKPFTGKTAARVWKMPEHEARLVLDDLADRAILLDIERNGQSTYVLPPSMAGFFEFSMIRLRAISTRSSYQSSSISTSMLRMH